MRYGVFPILRILSGELPINDRNNLAIAHDEIAWAEVCLGEEGVILTGTT
jgi:hypothetical protein